MTKPTKRARKKDSTMLNNQARRKEIQQLRVRVQYLEKYIDECLCPIYANLMKLNAELEPKRGKK